MTASAHDDMNAATLTDLTERMARLEERLDEALTANARLRRGVPDFAASMDAGLTETLAAYDARLALNAKVRNAAQPIAEVRARRGEVAS